MLWLLMGLRCPGSTQPANALEPAGSILRRMPVQQRSRAGSRVLYNRSVSESHLQAFVGSRTPVSTVRAGDVRRVWSILASQQAQTGISLDILAGLCEPKADALAVWFRASLIQALLHLGRLDPWRSGSTLQDKVFDVAATFPLPNGPAEADLDAFVAAMEQSSPSSS
jgi:hypothetical protein